MRQFCLAPVLCRAGAPRMLFTRGHLSDVFLRVPPPFFAVPWRATPRCPRRALCRSLWSANFDFVIYRPSSVDYLSNTFEGSTPALVVVTIAHTITTASAMASMNVPVTYKGRQSTVAVLPDNTVEHLTETLQQQRTSSCCSLLLNERVSMPAILYITYTPFPLQK